MKVKTARKLRTALVLLGVAIMLCGSANQTVFIIGAVVACSCYIPHFLFNKCPHCRKNLGMNEADHCQHCGKPID